MSFWTGKKNKAMFLHLGGPKTGSSAIQSWLAQNRGFLEKNGVVYPEHQSDGRAIAGRISSGNGISWAKNPYKCNLQAGTLWSAEQMFQSASLRERLAQESDNVDFPIVVCGYFRNPVEWAISAWMQRLKRGGDYRYFDDVLSTYDFRREKSLIEWLELSQLKNVEVKFSNYSNHKNSLISHFLTQLLSISPPENKKGEAIDASRINRSLNAAEIELMVHLNKATGGDRVISRLVSDSLVEQLPRLGSSQPTISEESFLKFEEGLRPYVERVNDFLAPDDKMKVSRPESSSVSSQSFAGLSSEWFQVLGNTIGLLAKKTRRN